MILIRKGTFETNSSSTHSLTMCTKEEYDKWIIGELFYFMGKEIFVDEKGKEERKTLRDERSEEGKKPDAANERLVEDPSPTGAAPLPRRFFKSIVIVKLLSHYKTPLNRPI